MKRRILLVDDDAAVLLTLKAVLELNQFEVDTAASAVEADARFHVLRAAREQPYNPATALLTAYPPMDGDWRHSGAQSLLVKPIGTQDLMRQIEALLVTHEDQKRGPRLDMSRRDTRNRASKSKVS